MQLELAPWSCTVLLKHLPQFQLVYFTSCCMRNFLQENDVIWDPPLGNFALRSTCEQHQDEHCKIDHSSISMLCQNQFPAGDLQVRIHGLTGISSKCGRNSFMCTAAIEVSLTSHHNMAYVITVQQWHLLTSTLHISTASVPQFAMCHTA